MNRPHLNDRRIDAMLVVLNEFQAGHDAEMVKAIGMVASEAAGEVFLTDLDHGVEALRALQERNAAARRRTAARRQRRAPQDVAAARQRSNANLRNQRGPR